MRVSELRIGTELLNGRVIVTWLKRDGAFSDIELTSGATVRKVRLHKTQSIMTVLVGACEAGKGTGSYSVTPHKVRASNPVWRGERAESRPYASWDDTRRGARKGSHTVESGGVEPSVRTDSRY